MAKVRSFVLKVGDRRLRSHKLQVAQLHLIYMTWTIIVPFGGDTPQFFVLERKNQLF